MKASSITRRDFVRLETGAYDVTAGAIGNFFRAVETRHRVVEGEIFGIHIAVACHIANQS